MENTSTNAARPFRKRRSESLRLVHLRCRLGRMWAGKPPQHQSRTSRPVARGRPRRAKEGNVDSRSVVKALQVELRLGVPGRLRSRPQWKKSLRSEGESTRRDFHYQ